MIPKILSTIPKFRTFTVSGMNVVKKIDWETGLIYLDNGDVRMFHQLTLMESTGLLDKNDKEIFDGDIVRYGDVVNYFIGWSTERYGFGFFLKPYEHLDNIKPNKKLMVVIGNIYENPELVK